MKRLASGSRRLYDPVNVNGVGSDNMKPLFLGLGLLFMPMLCAAQPATDPLDTLIVEYEAYVSDVNPEKAYAS